MRRNILDTLHRYRTVVAAVAILLFAAMTIGVIWYIRTARGPLAPTAPESLPQAAQLQCSTALVVPNECLSMTHVGEGNRGDSISFVCEGLPGTDNYRFRYKTSPDGAFMELPSNGASSSAIIVGDYLNVRCNPCAGNLCATAENVSEKCSFVVSHEVIVTPSPVATPEISPSPVATPEISPSPVATPEITPSPSPSPSPSVTPSPAPTPSPSPSPVASPKAPQCDSECVTNSDCPANLVCDAGRCRNQECTEESDCTCEAKKVAGFFVQKFHDKDGDGARDSGESGLDWEFEWDRNEDENWRKYVTYENNDGKGGTVGDLTPGDKIRVREVGKGGWVATTATEKTLTIEDGRTVSAVFGNRQPGASPLPASPLPASSPKLIAQASPKPELPKSGSTAQTVGLLSIGVLAMGIGIYRFYLRRQ
jgi:hypothetical protein